MSDSFEIWADKMNLTTDDRQMCELAYLAGQSSADEAADVYKAECMDTICWLIAQHKKELATAEERIESVKIDLGRAIDGGVDNRCEVLELERERDSLREQLKAESRISDDMQKKLAALRADEGRLK